MRCWIRIDHSFWMQPEIAFRKRAPHPEISARRDRPHVLHPRDRGWFLNDDLRHKLPRAPAGAAGIMNRRPKPSVRIEPNRRKNKEFLRVQGADKDGARPGLLQPTGH